MSVASLMFDGAIVTGILGGFGFGFNRNWRLARTLLKLCVGLVVGGVLLSIL